MPGVAAHESSTAAYADDDARWRAVAGRHRAADGEFFYAVRTTGVYCRPACAARQPRRENVRFFASAADAERAGYRACKRCRPGEVVGRHEAAVAAACRLIDADPRSPDLAALAGAAGMSRFHFHRVFRALVGLTPKAYAAARRGDRLREALSAEAGVAQAAFAAGFNSSSQLYAASDRLLGMAPATFRQGGAGAAIRFAVGQCSLGAILVAATERGVCEIALGDDPQALVRDLEDRFHRAELSGGDREFDAIVARVVGLVESPRPDVRLPLDVRGTAFQRRVWHELARIPLGARTTYAEVARRLGAPRATRAVAAACAANRLALAIPCHRVVRTDGSLAGYRWGVERKQALLAREAATGDAAAR
jgi:AraC family transcriptional regulator of adaptative response/methylated-DNA-[protein]-cysteine methyltransferase